MVARERVEFDVIGRDVGGSKAFDGVGTSADRAGDKVKAAGEKADKTSEQYRGLAHEVGEVERSIRALATEIDRTGNKDLIKDLNRQRAELRKLNRVRDVLPDDDESHREAVRFGGRLAESIAEGLSKAGGPVAGVLSKVFGTLPPQAQTAIGAGLVGAATIAAPGLGAVISSAVIGAAGAGGIVGGILVAAQHEQVQAAAKQVGEDLKQELREAAVSFVPATVESLGIVRSRIGEITDDFERASEASSKLLPPLTEKVMNGLTRAVDGFATAVERSGPVMDALGTIAERTGDVLADTFEGLSKHAPEAADALMTVWSVFEYGIRSVAGTVQALTTAYGWMEKFGAFLRGDVVELAQLAAESEAAKSGTDNLTGGLRDLVAGFRDTNGEVVETKVQLRSLKDLLDDFAGKTLDVREASRNLEAAVDDAREAVKRNGRTLDENTPKGRENQAALDGIARAARREADAVLAATGSQEQANAVMTSARGRFIAAAEAMGMSAGKAKALADRLFAIPNVDRTVTVRTQQAQEAIARVQAGLGRINSKDIRIGVYYTTKGDLKVPGGTIPKGFAGGGPIEHLPGPRGVDSGFIAAANGEHMLSAQEVTGLGGHQAVEQLRAAARGERPAASPAAGAGRAGDPVLADQIGRRVAEELVRALSRMSTGGVGFSPDLLSR